MNKFFKLISAAIMLVAAVSASSACIWILYQPKVPKSLK